MNNVSPAGTAWRPEYITDLPYQSESSRSGVSWAAVIGGAFVAASIALILMILGVGLGLSSISPWSGAGAGAATIGVSAIVWLVATQAIAAGLGGYLAGRLRTKWASVHGDEVYFRDTAHGFLVWAVAVVITAAFLGSVTASIVGGAAKLAGATAAAGLVAGAPLAKDGASAVTGTAPSAQSQATAPGGVALSSGYLTDAMLRSERPAADASPTVRPEIGRILGEALRKGSLPDTDRTYAARLIAAQTGLSQSDAEKRVDAVYAQGKSIAADAELQALTAADEARKAAAKTSLWVFVALLIGAFCASLAATLGGRQRDGVAAPSSDPALRRESTVRETAAVER